MKTLELIEKSGLSKAHIAKEIRTSPQNLNNILVRGGNFPAKYLKPLAKVLKVKISDLC